MTKIKLSEFISDYGDGIHGTPKYSECGDYYFINGNNLENGSIVISDDVVKIDSQEYERIKRPLGERTILLSINGSLGKTAFYRGEKVALGKSACYINVKNGYSKEFLRYVLTTKEFQKYMLQVAHGSTIKNFAPSQVGEYEVELPAKEEHEPIAMLLTKLDDKIDNNNAICSNLEAMAKLLYDYWFVQFDFPDENGKPYKSSGGKMVWNDELRREIPAGWEVKRFDEVLMFQKGRIPEELLDVEDAEHNSPYITIDVANNGLPQYCSSKGMVPCHGETLMVMDGAASGDVYIGYNGSLGSTLAMLSSKRNDVSDPLIYMMLKSNMPIYKRANVGSTVPHANRSFIEQMKIALPNDANGLCIELDKIFLKIVECRRENQQLASLRDFLLPMLMNGQVKVGKVET